MLKRSMCHVTGSHSCLAQPGIRSSLATCPACVARRSMTIPHCPSGLRWTPDGSSIAYVDPGTQMNIWVQPLDGIARQLTPFADGRRVVGFRWSRDGRRLAILRATITNDIVLFKGL
jgi:hypothetical protein